jgi:hypothetical protein
VFDLHFNFILLAIRRLAALEAAARAEEGRGAVGDKLYSQSAQPEPIPINCVVEVTHSMGGERRRQMAGEKRGRTGRGRGERRGLGCALLLCAVVGDRHRRGGISIGCIYARARGFRVGFCARMRVRGRVLRRGRWQLHWNIDRRLNIAAGIGCGRLRQFEGDDIA